MPKKERWGRPYPDRRDWYIYNECLVKRGEFYLSFDFVDQWDDELAQMNAGKPGRPFQYPESFIECMARIYVFFQLPYRQMEVLSENSRHSFRVSRRQTIPPSFAESRIWISRSK